MKQEKFLLVMPTLLLYGFQHAFDAEIQAYSLAKKSEKYFWIVELNYSICPLEENIKIVLPIEYDSVDVLINDFRNKVLGKQTKFLSIVDKQSISSYDEICHIDDIDLKKTSKEGYEIIPLSEHIDFFKFKNKEAVVFYKDTDANQVILEVCQILKKI